MEVPLDIYLRDLQQPLCKAFGVHFPAMQANVKVGEVLYDEFIQRPFMDFVIMEDKHDIIDGTTINALVTFESTSNSFWFDWNDRRGSKNYFNDVEHSEEVSLLAQNLADFHICTDDTQFMNFDPQDNIDD